MKELNIEEPAHHRGRSADCSRIDAPRAARGSAGVQFTPAGLADGELFGLNKRGNLILNLRGVGDGTGVGVGLGDARAAAFLRVRLGFGEVAGASAGEGSAAVLAGESVPVFVGVRCFDGEGDSMGVPVSNCD